LNSCSFDVTFAKKLKNVDLKMKKHLLTFLLFFISVFATLANVKTEIKDSIQAPITVAAPVKKWFDKYSIRGYTQVRYNRFFETNPKLKCEACDRSWGENGGVFIRRARVVLLGNVSDRVSVYTQLDLSQAVSGTAQHFAQARDLYFDVALDEKKEFKVRVGQSKIPFGFANLQSSQNRLTLDRDEALNSAAPGERDLGFQLMWTPQKTRHLFLDLMSRKLKGSGDYGLVNLAVINGQTVNRAELNNKPHIVARVSYPIEFKNKQIIEAGIQAMTGDIVVAKTDAKVLPKDVTSFLDERVAASFILYPQPFGFQAEYTIGKGPEYSPSDNTIKSQNLRGGYAQAMYHYQYATNKLLIPFARYGYYEGGKKNEIDARQYIVKELEFGAEWQPYEAFELTVVYVISDRTFQDSVLKDNRQKGNLLRIQAQMNF
jgi:hypothetical protein